MFPYLKKSFWFLIILSVVFVTILMFYNTNNLNDETLILAEKEMFSLTTKQEGFGCTHHSRQQNTIVEDGFYHNLETSNGTFKMLSAFYDARQPKTKWPSIHIISLVNVKRPTVSTYCQLWFDGIDAPIISHVHKYQYLFLEAWGFNDFSYCHYRLSCANPLASFGKIPTSVSIVEKPCSIATNLLEINYNLPPNNVKQPIAICTKPFALKADLSMRIIEWVETWFVLGISKIFLSVDEIHPEMKKTLDFYESTGKIEYRVFPKQLNNSWFPRHEMVPLNDCLLRHMHEYKFLLPVDIDEIIVPTTRQDKNLVEFLDRMILKSNLRDNLPADYIFDAYVAKQSYFFLDNNHKGEIQPEVPENFHFLQKVHRAVNYHDNIGPKSFQHTETVDVMHNHWALFCVKDTGDGNWCGSSGIDLEDAKLHHYRSSCNLMRDVCEDLKTNTTRDDTLWLWKDEIIKNVYKTLDDLETYRLEAGLA